MRLLLVVLLIGSCLGGCSVSFHSSQYDMLIRPLLDRDRANLQKKLWNIRFEGRNQVAYVVVDERGAGTFYSLNQLEVDFSNNQITAIRKFGASSFNVVIEQQTANSLLIRASNGSVRRVECFALRKTAERVFSQYCGDGGYWQYENIIRLNEAGEIAFIQAHYAPDKPPLVLTFKQYSNHD